MPEDGAPTDVNNIRASLAIFLNQSSLEAKSQILNQHPHLLAGEAIQFLYWFVQHAQEEGARRILRANCAMLWLCRVMGAEEAIATFEIASRGQVLIDEIWQVIERLVVDHSEWLSDAKPKWALDFVNPADQPYLFAALAVAWADNCAVSPPAERADGLELAIQIYETALKEYTPEDTEPEWALTQLKLGLACANHYARNRSDKLERAIRAFNAALQHYTRDRVPGMWAKVQMELATVYLDRQIGNLEENIELAIAGYEAALEVRTKAAMPREWAVVQGRLSDAYAKRKRGDSSDNLERAIAGYESVLAAKDETDAITLMNMADVYQLRVAGDPAQNLERAIGCYDAALRALNPASAAREWAIAQMNRGAAYLKRFIGDPVQNLDESIAGSEAALRVFTAAETPEEWSICQTNLVEAYSRRPANNSSRYVDRLIETAEAALQVLTPMATPDVWGKVQMMLGDLYSDFDQSDRSSALERSIAAYTAALSVFTKDSHPVIWGGTHMNLATVYTKRILGDPAENIERAIAEYELSLEVLTRERIPYEWAGTLHNLGSAYTNRIHGDRAENIERAIRLFEMSLQVRTRSEMPIEWGATIGQLGSAFHGRPLGKPAENLERAIELFQEALTALTQENAPDSWATVQMNLGNAYAERRRDENDIECAIAAFDAALKVRNRTDQPVDWAITQINLANAYAARLAGDAAANVEAAIAGNLAALEVLTRENGPVEYAGAQSNLAGLYHSRVNGDDTENLELAIAWSKRALETYRADSLPVYHYKTQLNLGRFYFKLDRWAEAAASFQQALAVLDRIYAEGGTSDARWSALRSLSGREDLLAYALAKTDSDDALEEAVVALEAGRGRVIAEKLALDRVPLDQVVGADRGAFSTTLERLRKLQSEARIPEKSPGRRGFIEISADLRETYAALEAIVQRIRGYVPDFLPRPDLPEIRSASQTGPLIYVIYTPAGGLAIIVEGERPLQRIWLPDLSERALIEKVNKHLYSHRELSQWAEWFDTVDDLLAWLGTSLMKDVLPAIKGKDAVIIASGVLGLLPLHACCLGNRPQGRSHYMLDDVSLRYAPSARVLLAATKAAQPMPDSLLAVCEPRPLSAAPLPHSELEVLAAATHFQRSRVLQHEDATREALIREIGNYAVLHMSCHGLADFREPLNSGVLLANNRILSLRDILDMSWQNSRLIILSACETALAGVEVLNEVLSLPSGFLQAGTEGVIGSLWRVADMSTMMLMSRFYDFWLDEGMKPHQALRAAQQWVRDSTNGEKVLHFKKRLCLNTESMTAFLRQLEDRDPNARDFDHAFYWAAFCYTGV